MDYVFGNAQIKKDEHKDNTKVLKHYADKYVTYQSNKREGEMANA